MWPRFGIKIGNSTVCVASAKDDGKVEVIANKHGNRVSQAVLLSDGGEIEVGLTAKQKLTSKSTASVVNNFQLFAKDLSEEHVARATKTLTCRYNRDFDRYELKAPPQPGGDPDESTDAGSLSPYQVCVEFFKASFELARQCHILEEHPSVVLSIPHYYSTESWMNLATAGEEAGFHVVQVISEHTAAVLAYELVEREVDTPKRVLCIKSGGLLTSVSLLDICNGLVSTYASAGPFYIGGKQFTDVLEEFISKEFYKKYKLDPQESRRSIQKIHSAAESCKHILTSLPSTQIYIDSLMDGVDFNVQMSRARYEMLIQPPLAGFMSILNDAIETMTTQDENGRIPIDEIVIAGGTMKIPKLQSAISSRFPDAQLYVSHPQDEVVAIGCARQSLHADPGKQDLEIDAKCSCVTSDIFLWHENNTSQQQRVVGKGSLLPTQTIVDVEKSTPTNDRNHDNDDDDDSYARFHVQTENSVGEIQVADAKAIDGFYRIKAIVEEIDGRPKITLSSAT